MEVLPPENDHFDLVSACGAAALLLLLHSEEAEIGEEGCRPNPDESAFPPLRYPRIWVLRFSSPPWRNVSLHHYTIYTTSVLHARSLAGGQCIYGVLLAGISEWDNSVSERARRGSNWMGFRYFWPCFLSAAHLTLISRSDGSISWIAYFLSFYEMSHAAQLHLAFSVLLWDPLYLPSIF